MKVEKDIGDRVNWHVEVCTSEGEDMECMYQENIKESAFATDEVAAMLRRHFSRIEIMDKNGSALTEITERVFFVCKKE